MELPIKDEKNKDMNEKDEIRKGHEGGHILDIDRRHKLDVNTTGD